MRRKKTGNAWIKKALNKRGVQFRRTTIMGQRVWQISTENKLVFRSLADIADYLKIRQGEWNDKHPVLPTITTGDLESNEDNPVALGDSDVSADSNVSDHTDSDDTAPNPHGN